MLFLIPATRFDVFYAHVNDSATQEDIASHNQCFYWKQPLISKVLSVDVKTICGSNSQVVVYCNEFDGPFFYWKYFLIDCSKLEEGRKEMFYLTTHSTHYIYDYMASGIW